MQKRRDLSKIDSPTQLNQLVRDVQNSGDEVILEEDGVQVAALVPIERYGLLGQARDRVMELADKAGARNKNVPFETIEREVAEAVKEVRREMPSK